MSRDVTHIDGTPLTLVTADGYHLSAICYTAVAPVVGHLVVAGATAV
jgi:predicted alpha/beta hydrolase